MRASLLSLILKTESHYNRAALLAWVSALPYYYSNDIWKTFLPWKNWWFPTSPLIFAKISSRSYLFWFLAFLSSFPRYYIHFSLCLSRALYALSAESVIYGEAIISQNNARLFLCRRHSDALRSRLKQAGTALIAHTGPFLFRLHHYISLMIALLSCMRRARRLYTGIHRKTGGEERAWLHFSQKRDGAPPRFARYLRSRGAIASSWWLCYQQCHFHR